MKKRFFQPVLSLIISLSFIFACSIAVNASTKDNQPTISVESKASSPGEEVQLNVNIKNNQGIAGAILRISYSSKLTLTEATSGADFSDLNFTKPGKYESPCVFLWDSESGCNSMDGTLLSLKFKVADDVYAGERLDVNISCVEGDIYDENLDNIECSFVNGGINIRKYSLGDIDGDGVISIKDASLIQKHITHIVTFDSQLAEFADVNEDGVISIVDVTDIQRYLVKLITSLGKIDETQPSTSVKYNVVFKDSDGTTIKSDSIPYGESATAPETPVKEGYIFTGWSKSFDKVTQDIEVVAQYKKITNPTVYVQSIEASPGETVVVPVKMYNNPGINGFQLNVENDSKITLKKAENGTALSTLFFTQPGSYANTSKFLWDGIEENDKGNGILINLTYSIPESAKSGDKYEIKVSIPAGSAYDAELNDVEFDIINSSINIK